MEEVWILADTHKQKRQPVPAYAELTLLHETEKTPSLIKPPLF